MLLFKYISSAADIYHVDILVILNYYDKFIHKSFAMAFILKVVHFTQTYIYILGHFIFHGIMKTELNLARKQMGLV